VLRVAKRRRGLMVCNDSRGPTRQKTAARPNTVASLIVNSEADNGAASEPSSARVNVKSWVKD